MKKFNQIIGYLSVAIIFAGIMFKVQHWPGASILLFFGTLSFTIGYALTYLFLKFSQAENSTEKFFSFWVVLLMIYLPTSFLFKMMHFPGANIMMLIGNALLVLTIPLFIYRAVKEKKDALHHESIILIFLTAFSIFIGYVKIGNDIYKHFLPINDTNKKEAIFQANKTNEMFVMLEATTKGKSAGQSWLEKANSVRNSSDSLIQYIRLMGEQMMQHADKKPVSFDSLQNLLQYDNTFESNQFLIQEDNGSKLKNKIIAYKEFISPITNSRGKEIIDLFFETNEPVVEKDQEPATWSSKRFRNMPLIAVITNFSQMISHIRLLEAETMNYLHYMGAKEVMADNAKAEKKEVKKSKP